MKKAIVVVLVLTMVLSVFAGCAAEDESEMKVGVTLLTKNDEWLAAISDEFEKQCGEKGYKVNIQDAEQNNEKQVQQIENFIVQKYDVIIVSAANVEGVLPAIDKAEAAGIPVVAIDTPINHDHVSTCISWDNFETGKVLGEYMKSYTEEHFADKEEVNLVIINAPAYPHLVKRDEGMMSVLDTVEKIHVIASQDAAGSRETSANIINNNIAKGVDLVYGVVDNHAWGAVTALEEAAAEGTAVFSCGGFGTEPFDALQADHKYYTALIVVPPKNIVSDTLKSVEQVLNGESVDGTINIEFGLADAENVSEYLN